LEQYGPPYSFSEDMNTEELKNILDTAELQAKYWTKDYHFDHRVYLNACKRLKEILKNKK